MNGGNADVVDHDADEPTDEAMAAEKGGIDMNEIELQREGAGVDIRFDPAVLESLLERGFDGLAPIIINITPIPSIYPLLGLDPRGRKEDYELSQLN